MDQVIRLGISTCPNDTFAFHAILEGSVETHGIKFEIELLDIEELNQGLLNERFDVCKASFAAALSVADRVWVLPSGSALGFGVGPLLLAAEAKSIPESPEQTTLCPGEHTTANLLFKLFYPRTTQIEQTVFSDIMPRLRSGSADFGVCIHEGRFTWQQQGLHLVEDLGTRWEHATGAPLPLGGLFADRTLPQDLLGNIQRTVRASLDYSLEHRQEALTSMRRYAQEFDDDVLMQHVDLYVNEWTVCLGTTGQQALAQLSDRVQAAGFSLTKPLEILPVD